MKTFKITLLCLFVCPIISYGQTVQDIIDEVNLDALTLTVNEFSGEQSTIVNGNAVTIINRQQSNNDLAGDYLVEKFEQLDNVTITDQQFDSNGRNIIATQLGKTNPENIYIICAHYDSVADYCADDNATGTAAVLEAARVLSTQCMDNTIVYALWDEEEIGLNGSSFYANQAASNTDNILGVLNMDMIGYDGDAPGTAGDNQFDIDVRNFANSIAMKDDIISVLNTYPFDLSVITVDEGTFSSDHSSFWGQGYSAVLVGESWETNDQTPFYHSSSDRVGTLDLPYFHELTKLVTAYMATVGGLLSVDNTISQTELMLTADQTSANYQWFDCDTNLPISGATNQSFSPSSNGIYAVEVTIGSCTEKSDCIVFDTLDLESFSAAEVKVFPNPVKTYLNVDIVNNDYAKLDLYDVTGKLLWRKLSFSEGLTVGVKDLPFGIYFLKVTAAEKSSTFKIVKE